MPNSTPCTHQEYCEMRDETDMRFISHLTRNTFAIILAGGRGSRLKQLTDFRSKPAVPFAGKFRILDFTLSNCVNSGIRKIGVATQYKAHSLIRHIQRGWSFLDGRFDEFIQLLPAQQQIDETQWYQGTADAVFQNMHFLRRYNPEHILIVAGDHIFPHIVPRYRVFAHRFADSCVGSEHHRPYWRDVGTIDAYWEANMEMTKVTPELNLYDKDWPIWTYQEQLPPAKFVFDDDGRRGMAIDSLISGGCIISGAAVKRSLLFSSVTVHSWASIEDSVILPGVDVGRHAILKRCVIDKNCRIPAKTVIGVDAEADRERFSVSPKGITLVTAEMLGQGAAEVH